MTDPQTPPPPHPPSGPHYVLFGFLGVIVGLVVVVIILLVSGGDDEPASTTVAANPTVAASSSTSDLPPTTTLPQFPGDTGDEVAAGDPTGSFNFLHDVRVRQREQGFTRVVFDFEDGDIPWWSVGYAAGPFTSMGDEPIPIAGTEFLRVVLSSVGYDLSGAEVRITYNGPERIAADTNSVIEILLIDAFEGVSTWVIGVDGMKPFVVGTLDDPPRVYIDIGD